MALYVCSPSAAKCPLKQSAANWCYRTVWQCIFLHRCFIESFVSWHFRLQEKISCYTEFKLKTLTALYSSAGRTDKRDILDSSWSTTCLWCHTQRPTVLILQYELRWRGSAGERPEHVVTYRHNTEQRTECNENWQSEPHAKLTH